MKRKGGSAAGIHLGNLQLVFHPRARSRMGVVIEPATGEWLPGGWGDGEVGVVFLLGMVKRSDDCATLGKYQKPLCITL